MVKLVIVESPAKCKKIQSYLGDGFRVKASFGHFREIKNGLKGIDMTTYLPTFKISNGKQKYVNDLKKSILDSSKVYLATDDDREGEAIAWHICDTFRLSVSTTPRLIFHEITKTAIQRAIQHPTTLDIHKVNAQFARQVLDLLIGYTVSPLLWKAIPSPSRNTTLSAGRCQTPALRIVYDRNVEIQKARGIETYSITGCFLDKKVWFTLEPIHNTKQNSFKLDTYFSTKEHVEDFLETSGNFEHCFTRTKPVHTSHSPPKPFTTSRLQQCSNSMIRFTPKKTMQNAQKLYEAGMITYMRTDSLFYSSEFVDSTLTYITSSYGEEYQGTTETIQSIKGEKKSKKSKSNAQEAHEAIRPTNLLRNPSSITDTDQRKLYKLIWENTIASCMAHCTGFQITCMITAPPIKPPVHYVYKEEKYEFLGWKIVYSHTVENEIYDYLNTLNQSTYIDYIQIIAKPSIKDTKNHYTEAKLVQLLEQKGIGRPSTFSSLVEKIQTRKYVKCRDIQGITKRLSVYTLHQDELIEEEQSITMNQEKHKLDIEPIGKTVIEFLIHPECEIHSLFEYDYTAKLEHQLDQVSNGMLEWTNVVKECHTLLNESMSSAQSRAKEISNEKKIKIAGSVEQYQQDQKEKRTREETPLGFWNETPIYIRKGRYGQYIQVGNHSKQEKAKTVSLNSFTRQLTLENVIEYLKNPPLPKNTKRIFDENTSLRVGKYGEYIFYKKPHMTKPKFINLKQYSGDIHNDSVHDVLEWVSFQLDNQ